MLTLDAVTVRLGGRTILDRASASLPPGSRVGLIGRNGAGKSTLLKLLTGELEPDSGTVKLAKTLDAIVIDQQRSLMAPEKTVREVLADTEKQLRAEEGFPVEHLSRAVELFEQVAVADEFVDFLTLPAYDRIG